MFLRRPIAVLLYLFAGAVFIWSAVQVYDARFGVPKGLTGGRSGVALPGDAAVEVQGGFVRSVEGTNVTIRSLSPTPVLSFSNAGREAVSLSVSLTNVKPLAMRGAWFPSNAPLSRQEAVEFRPADPGAVRFTVSLPPGDARTYAFEQQPAFDVVPVDAPAPEAAHPLAPRTSDGATSAGAAPSPTSVRFFVFGGVRDGRRTFERILAAANEESPDFMVGLGDTYYRANVPDILRAAHMLGRSSVPVYLLPGEIEYRSPDKPDRETPHQLGNFYTLDRHAAIFGPSNNEFSFGGWRFVFLENSRKRNRASLRWLDKLPPGDAAAPRTIFFSHIPPFDPRKEIFKDGMTTGVPHEHERVVRAMGELAVAAAFFGHYHGYAEGEVAGISCYVTSAAGVKLPRGAVSHFLDVALGTDGTVSVTRRPIENGARRLEAAGDGGVPATEVSDDASPGPGGEP